MASKPAKTGEVATIEAVAKVAAAATREQAEFLSLQTAGIREERASYVLERAAALDREQRLREELRAAQSELATERAKSLERDIAFRKLDNDRAEAEARTKQIAATFERMAAMGLQAFMATQAAKGGGNTPTLGAGTAEPHSTAHQGPELERLLDGLIRDLSAETLSKVYGKIRPVFLPLLKPEFLHAGFLVIGRDEEIGNALRKDLGATTTQRISELAKAAGFG